MDTSGGNAAYWEIKIIRIAKEYEGGKQSLIQGTTVHLLYAGFRTACCVAHVARFQPEVSYLPQQYVMGLFQQLTVDLLCVFLFRVWLQSSDRPICLAYQTGPINSPAFTREWLPRMESENHMGKGRIWFLA